MSLGAPNMNEQSDDTTWFYDERHKYFINRKDMNETQYDYYHGRNARGMRPDLTTNENSKFWVRNKCARQFLQSMNNHLESETIRQYFHYGNYCGMNATKIVFF